MNDLNGLFCWLFGWLIGGQWLQQPLTALTAFYYIREYEMFSKLVSRMVSLKYGKHYNEIPLK